MQKKKTKNKKQKKKKTKIWGWLARGGSSQPKLAKWGGQTTPLALGGCSATSKA
jgi:hypothetical protein